MKERWTLERLLEAVPKAAELALHALTTDGAHHKQWYLERIAETLGIDLADFAEKIGLRYEPGIAP